MPASSRHRLGRLRPGLLVLLLIAAAPVRAADTAADWLARMAAAMRTGAYEGTLVYEHGDQLDTMAIAHDYVDGTEFERLSLLNGSPFEILRRGDRVVCVWPAERRMMVNRRPGDLLAPRPPHGLRSLPAQYRAVIQGDGRVAGRDARILRIDGADRYRFGYRMWIDRQTGLLLRSDLIDSGGMVHERFLFTDLNPVDGIDPARFEPSLEGRSYTRHDSGEGDSARLAEPDWRVRDLPPGFQVMFHRSEAMPPHGKAVQHSVFSDGLAAVSLFVEPAESDAMPLRGPSSMGAVHAWGRVVDGHQITVVGEVPAATVRRIARSVEHVAGQ